LKFTEVLSEPEIGDFAHVVLQQDVGELQVPVNYVAGMKRLHPLQNLPE